jgi:hypothetical protein
VRQRQKYGRVKRPWSVETSGESPSGATFEHRWNFEWRGYVFVGVPGGITDKYVYEFKTTKSGILNYSKVVAHQQADLYGFFFDRPKKRVQVLMVDTGEIETWDEKVDEWRDMSRRNLQRSMLAAPRSFLLLFGSAPGVNSERCVL